MSAVIEQINTGGYTFVEFAASMLIQASVLIVLLFLADLALRRRVRAVFRYWMWLLVLVKLVLPTSLSGPFSIGYWFGDKLEYADVGRGAYEPRTAGPMMPALPYIDISNVPPAIYPPATSPAPGEVEVSAAQTIAAPAVPPAQIEWQGIVFLLWLAVAAAMALLLAQRAVFVRGLVAQAGEASRPMYDALEECRSNMKVRGKVGLKVSPNAASPAVCGLLRPVILVPQNFASALDTADLRIVLLHELAHVKRGDLWVNLAQTVLQIVYFYNPLLWLANAVIRRAREQAVDEAVLVAMGEGASRYPQTLVSVAKLAFKRPALSLRLIGVVESKSALTARVKRILSRPIPKSAKLGILGLAAIIITAAFILPMAHARGYTDRAAQVLKLAEKEARGFNHAYIGTEHILLALAGQSDGVAAKVLDKLGVDKDALQEELKKLVKTGAEPVTKSRLPQTPRAKKIFEHARNEAMSLDHDYIGTEHILLGLLQEKDGVAGQMLANLGVSLDVARAEALDLVKPGPNADGMAPSMISGQVLDDVGEPVTGAQVGLSTADIGVGMSNGKLEPIDKESEGRITVTDSQGAFNLGECPDGDFDLIVACDDGFAFVESKEFGAPREIRIRPWGRIEGQLASGRKATENKIWVASLPNYTMLLQRWQLMDERMCDGDGRFVFDKVPAGWFEVGFLVPTGRSGSSITCRTPVVVEAGQTSKMTLGGTGRPVVGKFIPPAGYDEPIPFDEGLRSLVTARPKQPRPDNYEQMTKEQQHRWYLEWRKTDEYQDYLNAGWRNNNWRQYTFRINKDGSFRIEDVIAAKYEMDVSIERLPGGGPGEEIGGYYGAVEMPPIPGGRSDEPLDLGTLELHMAGKEPPAEPASPQPEYSAKLANGMRVELLAVCEFVGGKAVRSWKPDGASVEKPFYLDYGGVYRTKAFALVFNTDKPAEIIKYDAQGATDRLGPLAVVDEGGELTDLAKAGRQHARAFRIDNLDSTELVLIVAPKWGGKIRYDGKYVLGSGDPKITFFETYETGEGVRAIFKNDYPRSESRLQAVLTGEAAEKAIAKQRRDRFRVDSTISVVQVGEGEKRNSAFFEDTKLSDVKYFELVTRAFPQRVTFKNISLKPNIETDVEIKVESEKIPGVVGVEDSTLGKSTSAEAAFIIQKVLDRYAAIKTYSAIGELLTDVNHPPGAMGAIPGMTTEMLQQMGEQQLKSIFTIKMARPNLYCIEWNEHIDTNLSKVGNAWSVGDGSYGLILGKEKSFEKPLRALIGTASDMGKVQSSLFFDTSLNTLRELRGLSQQEDEQLEGVECYVISGSLHRRTYTYWVSKKDFLIRRYKFVSGGDGKLIEGGGDELTDETIKESLKAMDKEATPEEIAKMRAMLTAANAMASEAKVTNTETYRNIILDQPISKEQFVPSKDIDEITEELKNLRAQYIQRLENISPTEPNLKTDVEVKDKASLPDYEVYGAVVDVVPDSWWEDCLAKLDGAKSEEEFDSILRSLEPQPAVGVTVKLEGRSRGKTITKEAVTDKDGKYMFTSLPVAWYGISCEKAVTETRTGENRMAFAKGGRHRYDIDIPRSQCVNLRLRDDYVTVKGRITDTYGHPLGGVEVRGITGPVENDGIGETDEHTAAIRPQIISAKSDHGFYELTGFEPAKLVAITRYLANGSPGYELGHKFYVDVTVGADDNTLKRIPLVTEESLYRARRVFKAYRMLKQRTGGEEVQEKQDLPYPFASSHSNTITGINIILDQPISKEQFVPGKDIDEITEELKNLRAQYIQRLENISPTEPNLKTDVQVEVETPDEKAGVVWGEVVGGLRAAAEFVPEKESYTLGEGVEVRFHIQNVGSEDAEFASESTRQDWAAVKDSDGNDVKVDRRWHSGTVATIRHIIKPGQILTLKTSGLGFGDFDDPAVVAERKGPWIGSVVRCGPGQYSISYPVNRDLETGVRKVTVTERPPVDPRRFELVLDRQSMLQAVNELMQKYRVRICFEEIGSESGAQQDQLSGTFSGPTIPELLAKLTGAGPYKWEKFNRTYAVYPKQGSVLTFSVKTNISDSPLEDVARAILDQDPNGKNIEIEAAYKGKMRDHLWISKSSAMYALAQATESAGYNDIVWSVAEDQGRRILSLHKLGQAGQGAVKVESSQAASLPNSLAGPQGNTDEVKYQGRTIAEWISRFESESYDEQREAIGALARIGRSLVPAMIEEMKKGGIRASCARGVLGEMGPEAEEAVPWLIEVALDKDVPIDNWWESKAAYRECAVSCLNDMPWARDRVVPVLRRIAEDDEDDTRLRRVAMLFLRDIGKEAIPILRKVTETEEDEIRDAAHHMLAQVLQREQGLSKDDYYTPLIEKDPFGASIPEYLAVMKSPKSPRGLGGLHPLTQKIKKLYRERLANQPDPELAWRLATIIQNGLRNTDLEWAAPTGWSTVRWPREDPTENYTTLAEVLQLGFDHAESGSQLQRQFGISLAKLRLLQGDWDRTNAMLKELGQKPIPKESRQWLPAPPVDWGEGLGSQWKMADESMRSGNCSLEFRIEKGGKGLKGVHFLVKKAPESTNVINTGISIDTLFFEPYPLKGFSSFGYKAADRPMTRYAVSDESGIVRFEKLPNIPIKIEVLVPTSNFPEAVSNWDLWMEVEPGKYKIAKKYGAGAINTQVPPAVAELKEGQTVHYPNLVVRVEGETADEKAGLVWGEEVNGLRAAVEFVPEKEEYAFGEKNGLRFHIQNASDEPIQFVSSTRRQGHTAIVEDENGKAKSLGSTWYSGWVPMGRYYLEPAEEVVLESLAFGIAANNERLGYPVGYTFVCKPGTYFVRFPLIIPDGKTTSLPEQAEDWKGELETGRHKLVVAADSNSGNRPR